MAGIVERPSNAMSIRTLLQSVLSMRQGWLKLCVDCKTDMIIISPPLREYILM